MLHTLEPSQSLNVFPGLLTQDSVNATGSSKEVLRLCHQTLMCLGDLSRWRETQLVAKDRNWGPAISFYDLASRVYPASGASYNQLARIAQVEGDSFGAVYNLSRALAVEDPCRTSLDSLEQEFNRISDGAHEKDEPNETSSETFADDYKEMMAMFLSLHASYQRGGIVELNDTRETKVLKLLAEGIRRGKFPGLVLDKLVLINIAAEYRAFKGLGGYNSYSACQVQRH